MIGSSGKVFTKIGCTLVSFACYKNSELNYRKLTYTNAEKIIQFLLHYLDHLSVSTFKKYNLVVISSWSDIVIDRGQSGSSSHKDNSECPIETEDQHSVYLFQMMKSNLALWILSPKNNIVPENPNWRMNLCQLQASFIT